ncbi:type IV secretion protein Rhs, partial [Duganella sp. FT92W]
QLQQLQPPPVTGAARPAINYTYDALDQLSTVRDPRNLTTTYTSDGLGNRTGLASPDTGSTARTFDLAGNVLTSTDARGKVTTYTYDALNRVTSISYGGGTPTVLEYGGGPSGAPNAIGRLTKMTDESGQTAYAYDQAGRLLSKVQTITHAVGTVNRTVGYAYDGNGRLASLTYPSGNRIDYGYDANGRANKLTLHPSDANGGTDAATSIVLLDQITYAPFGGVQSWIWGNSTEAVPNLYARTFDLDGRLVTYPLGTVMRTVTYDAASRITAMTHTGTANAASYNQAFTYDGLGRLLTYTGNTGTQSYAYDATGNRIPLKIGASTYSNIIASASNRLNSTSGPLPAKSNTFDAAGNLTGDGTVSYTYGERGRIKTSVNAGVATSYLYNGIGQRTRKAGVTIPTGATAYVYDEQGHLLGEYDAAGAVLQETVFLEDMPVGVLKQAASGTPMVVTTSVGYIYSDHINTPRVVTEDASNSVVWNWVDADPFGMAQPVENAGGAVFSYNVRFPGQLYDKETNLHYNYYRDYDPQTGRYVQSDPIGLNGGVNTYGYVEGNPLSKVDPTGEVAFAPILIGIGAGLALDYALSEWKRKNCTCKDSGTPAGPAGNAGVGAADGIFGAHDVKPRGGIAGGGPAGRGTSIFSGLNHAAARSGKYSIATRNALTSIARKIPYVGTAIVGYEVYDALSCD